MGLWKPLSLIKETVEIGTVSSTIEGVLQQITKEGTYILRGVRTGAEIYVNPEHIVYIKQIKLK